MLCADTLAIATDALSKYTDVKGYGRNTTICLLCVTWLLSSLLIIIRTEFHYLLLWLLWETPVDDIACSKLRKANNIFLKYHHQLGGVHILVLAAHDFDILGSAPVLVLKLGVMLNGE